MEITSWYIFFFKEIRLGLISPIILSLNSLVAQEFNQADYLKLLYEYPDSAYNLSAQHYEDAMTDSTRAYSLHLMGNAAWVKGELIQAAYLYVDAVNLYQELEDSAAVKKVKLNLGNVLNDLSAYEMAKDYYYQSITDENAADIFNNIGTVLQREQNLYSAEQVFLMADSLYEVRQDPNRYLSQSNLGLNYTLKGEHRRAQTYIDQGFFFAKRTGDYKILAFNYLTKSYWCDSLNMTDSSSYYAHRSLQVSRDHQFKETMRDASMALYHYHRKHENLDSALIYLEQVDSIQKEMVSHSSNDLSILLSELFHEKARREKAQDKLEVAKLKSGLQRERSFKRWVILVSILTLFTGIMLWHYLTSRVKSKQLALELATERANRIESDLEKRKLESSKKQLQLELKEKELLTYALKEAEWNASVKELNDQIKTNGLINQDKQGILKNFVKKNTKKSKQWDDFRWRFEKVHESFFEKLLKNHPGLSINEQRLCAFTLLNLTSKEIASLQGIKASSVDIARHRLRAKLVISNDISLSNYLRQFT